MTMLGRRTFVLFAGLTLAVAGCASTRTAGQGAIKVENAWARRAPMAPAGMQGAMGGMSGVTSMPNTANGAVYATIRNESMSDDALVSVTSNAAEKVELHEVRNENGVMAMRPIDKLAVAAGGAVEMKPGGYHIMLLGLKRELNPGDSVPVTLTFQKSAPVTVNATVR
jgi:copper(I)-binding protein